MNSNKQTKAERANQSRRVSGPKKPELVMEKKIKPSEVLSPTVQNGEFVVTTSHILRAITSSNWSKGQGTKAVALSLLDSCEASFDWFSTGFDWALALAIPEMLKASRHPVHGRMGNRIFRLSIR